MDCPVIRYAYLLKMAKPGEGPFKLQSVKIKSFKGLGNGSFTIQGFRGPLQTLYQLYYISPLRLVFYCLFLMHEELSSGSSENHMYKKGTKLIPELEVEQST